MLPAFLIIENSFWIMQFPLVKLLLFCNCSLSCLNLQCNFHHTDVQDIYCNLPLQCNFFVTCFNVSRIELTSHLKTISTLTKVLNPQLI